MKAILNRLTQHETLEKEEAEKVLVGIAEGKYNPSEIASFLTHSQSKNKNTPTNRFRWSKWIDIISASFRVGFFSLVID